MGLLSSVKWGFVNMWEWIWAVGKHMGISVGCHLWVLVNGGDMRKVIIKESPS